MQVQVIIKADELIEKIDEFNRIANEFLTFINTNKTATFETTFTIKNEQQPINVEEVVRIITEELERELRK